MKCISFFLSTILFFGCSQKEIIFEPEQPFYYPIQTGNIWTYQIIYTLDSSGVTIMKDTAIFQHKIEEAIQISVDTVYLQQTYFPKENITWHSLVGFDDEGNYCEVDTSDKRISRTVIFPKNPLIGMVWEYSNYIICAPQGCDTLPSSRCLIRGKDKDCWIMEIHDLLGEKDADRYLYCSGIGLVSFVETSDSFADSLCTLRSIREVNLISFTSGR